MGCPMFVALLLSLLLYLSEICFYFDFKISIIVATNWYYHCYSYLLCCCSYGCNTDTYCTRNPRCVLHYSCDGSMVGYGGLASWGW